MREEFQQRLAKECRYALTKMQEATALQKKLFYFSIFFGEAQRVLNWEWDSDLILMQFVTSHVHRQIDGAIQAGQVLPVDWTTVFNKLTEAAADLTAYFDKPRGHEELCKILARFTEIAYATTGNGSYLHEKGVFKL